MPVFQTLPLAGREGFWWVIVALLAFSPETGLFAVPGDLDVTFGNGGSTTITLSAGTIAARALAVQADGRIVVAGSTNWWGSGFVLVRLHNDGTPDTSFGVGGYVKTDLGYGAYATDVAIQTDGRILVAGFGGNADIAVTRYLHDGSLDLSFSDDGKALLSAGGLVEHVSLAIQSDGKVIVSGGEFVVARYKTDGQLDTSFGQYGQIQPAFPNYGEAYVVKVRVAPSQSILLGGNVAGGSYATLDFALAKLKTSGQLATDFGDAGFVTTDLNDSNDNLHDLLVQQDGRVVAIGVPGSGYFSLLRYRDDGSLDPSFGQGGRVDTDFGGDDRPEAGAIAPDGKIVVVGFSHVDYDSKFAIARYNQDGSLDGHFGNCGKVTSDFGDPADVGVLCPSTRQDCSNDIARDVVIQADGNILVVGGSGAGTPSPDTTIARYIGSGSAGPDNDNDGNPDHCDLDDDNDGAPDADDRFPFDPSESVDFDNDGIGDTADPDDDNDGRPDTTDAFPLNASEWMDSDGDGIGDNADPIFGDQAAAYYPLNSGDSWHYASTYGDIDLTVLDGTVKISGFATREVSDNQGSSLFLTSDSNGIKRYQASDPGYRETYVPPIQVVRAIAHAGDVINGTSAARIYIADYGNATLTLTYRWEIDDTESISVPAGEFDTTPIRGVIRVFGTAFGYPIDGTTYEDYWVAKGIGAVKIRQRFDGIDDVAVLTTSSLDQDGDTVGAAYDNCADVANADQSDTDADGWGDACDYDDDGDGVGDQPDNCPLLANPGQLDNDQDSLGDACDPDDDNDGVADGDDLFPLNGAEWADNDGDGVGDNQDLDDDNDGLPDTFEQADSQLDPLDGSDAALDFDGDSLINIDEYLAGTDLHDPDSDHDGRSDADEIDDGQNPLVNEGTVISVINAVLLD